MNTVRRRTLAAFTMGLAVLVPRAAAAASTRAAEAWRLAGQAERILRLHLQAVHGVLAERARRALPEVSARLGRELARLRAASPPGEGREAAVLLTLLAADYRSWAGRAPSRETLRALAERVDEVAWAAGRAAELPGGGDGAAARAGWLAHRAARLLLEKRADAGASAGEALAAVTRAVEDLAQASPAPETLAAEVGLARNQLAFLAAAAQDLARDPAQARALEVAAKAADHLAESMERVERLLASG